MKTAAMATVQVVRVLTAVECGTCGDTVDVATMARGTDGRPECIVCHLFAREMALPVRDERVGCSKCGDEHALCREHPVLGWGCDDCTATEEADAYADGAVSTDDVEAWAAGRW